MTPETLENTEHRRLEHLDQEVDGLKRALDEAAASFVQAEDEVGSRPEVDGSLQKRLDRVSNRLKDLQPAIEDLDFDSDQMAALLTSILDVDRAVRSEGNELDRFEQMLLGVERVRQVIRDALDEFTGGEAAGQDELIRLLRQRLPGITAVQLSELLSVTPRTVSRWSSQAGRPSHRLSLVVKLVQILGHAWTPKGVMAWFGKPRARLGNKAPIEVLDDPTFELDLLAEARGGRNQYAT